MRNQPKIPKWWPLVATGLLYLTACGLDAFFFSAARAMGKLP